MFILRRYTGSGMEMNQIIGADYCISYLECNKEEFVRDYKAYFDKDYKEPNSTDENESLVYAFVSFSGKIQPLYKNQKAFIMTESGKTFANITFR